MTCKSIEKSEMLKKGKKKQEGEKEKQRTEINIQLSGAQLIQLKPFVDTFHELPHITFNVSLGDRFQPPYAIDKVRRAGFCCRFCAPDCGTDCDSQ